MKFLKPAAIAVMLLGSISCSREHRTSDEDIRNLYSRYQDAVRKMDAPRYMAFFTNDFTMRNPDGKVHDPAEMKKYQRVNAQTTKKVSSYNVEIEAITHPPDADFAVIVLQKYDRDQAPLEEPDKPHRIQTSAVQREIWRSTPQGPRISRIEEIMVGPVLFDGKRVQ